MAEIVAGFASSHTPMVEEPGENWEWFAKLDHHARVLMRPSDGAPVTYDELLASADPKIVDELSLEIFARKHVAIQSSLDELAKTFAEVNPDVVVMFGDDQEEVLFDDNYPMISVYWGEVMTHYPWIVNHPNLPPERLNAPGVKVYGDEVIEYPIETNLGLHLVEQLVERDFDVAQSRYMQEEYGGTVGPATWYFNVARTTPPRKQGMCRAYTFPICRWFAGKRPPAVPITINTCYPPNWISPRRTYALGRAVREAIEAWDSDARVAIVTSGGLSHFSIDEELDQLAIEGLTTANEKILTSLPRAKLQSATTEILNWVAVSAAMGSTPLELLTYQAGYRSPAGTGCGMAVGRWLP